MEAVMAKKIKVGLAGARAQSIIQGLKAEPDVEIAAICDLDEDRLNHMADAHNIPRRYRVFEDMADSDLDAIHIATPMQCHVPQALYALEAGKHVMSEVTAGVTMDELFWLCEAVERSGKIYMYAENYCYTPEVQLVKSLVDRGMFGNPYYAVGMYLHNCSDLIEYPNGKSSWRKYWQFGKRGNFYPTHSLGPVMTWLENERIREIATFAPVGCHNDRGVRQDDGTTTMCYTDSGKVVQIRVDCTSNRPHDATHYHLQGTKGAYQAAGALSSGPAIAIRTEEDPNGDQHWRPLFDFAEYLPDRYKIATDSEKNAGHGGGDFFIVDDFIQSIRENKEPYYNVYKACEWTAVGLLSELSLTNGSRMIEIPNFRKGMPREEQIIKI
jgi:predicted dehydrogenase